MKHLIDYRDENLGIHSILLFDDEYVSDDVLDVLNKIECAPIDIYQIMIDMILESTLEGLLNGVKFISLQENVKLDYYDFFHKKRSDILKCTNPTFVIEIF